MAASLLRNLLFTAPRRAPAPPPRLQVELQSGRVQVLVKRNAAARRFVLRLSRDGAGFTLTLPPRHSLASAQAFLLQSIAWMEKTLSRFEAPVPLADGASIPLRGRPMRISGTASLRGQLKVDEDAATLHVPGGPSHLRRRLVDWLKAQALQDLSARSRHYASEMGCSYKRITVRDQKSRWGSCAADGSLSYSWRLVLAPPHVLDYVAAHEVAHLLEMNHGPRFWRLVLTHCRDARAAKQWLKANGHSLHRYR